jgi:hypothetical protein
MKKMEKINQPKQKAGRKPRTEQEKKVRMDFLANESIEQRTKRVLNPRLKAFLKKFDAIISSVSSIRYRLTEEQATLILSEVEQRSIALNNAFAQKTTKKEEMKDIL